MSAYAEDTPPVDHADFSAENKIDIDKSLNGLTAADSAGESDLEGMDVLGDLHGVSSIVGTLFFGDAGHSNIYGFTVRDIIIRMDFTPLDKNCLARL